MTILKSTARILDKEINILTRAAEQLRTAVITRDE